MTSNNAKTDTIKWMFAIKVDIDAAGISQADITGFSATSSLLERWP